MDMTWNEFKNSIDKEIEKAKANGDYTVRSIDITYPNQGEFLVEFREEDNEMVIRHTTS